MPSDIDSTDTHPSDSQDMVSSGDTFGVGIHITESDLQFIVHVPSDINSGWTDPTTFQKQIETIVWNHLEKSTILKRLANQYEVGTTVSLGRITLSSDGTVHNISLINVEEL
ncbi:hypothetical protein [Haloquadratum walsbyi]|jgi:hypothetical protein|uniref:DUF8124 domain-containing protein n=1 Tax=Haloquadratum walsbyi J07HQW2 TaxID=1238425 RepID=U1NCP4_9EURY|nr:hypothetical protein [Haloquadratum walsbyi]ERG94705.1 MAG: hypothetical protein J07HQW2_01143 [Haloquadratum walsbyi J07HQW2]